jgi:hypothetical protein
VKKNLIPFIERTFRSMLISLLFHSILRHKQVVLENIDNEFFGVKNYIYCRNLGGS